MYNNYHFSGLERPDLKRVIACTPQFLSSTRPLETGINQLNSGKVIARIPDAKEYSQVPQRKRVHYNHVVQFFFQISAHDGDAFISTRVWRLWVLMFFMKTRVRWQKLFLLFLLAFLDVRVSFEELKPRFGFPLKKAKSQDKLFYFN